MNIQVTEFDSDRDLEAIKRLWHEIGWMSENSKAELSLLQKELALVRCLARNDDNLSELLLPKRSRCASVFCMHLSETQKLLS